MEAASARMATRDRYGGWAETAQTPLQRYIINACDPQNFEPNLALNLEITDMINSKKGNSPREAAISIVNYVNHRNPNVAILALNLLDICVKNCGYPFHLQISTKEFLNELVRRFPEKPPAHPTRVQMKILELIEEWRSTICQTSRYKDDLGFIRDMHRLLSYKGYLFPAVRKEDAAVLNPSDNLRSAEEMEEEERAAQSAKLQELIRRGGPRDLQEANKLMKVMAGYDTRNKTDWRAKAAEEVGRVQQKAKLLEDMLQRAQAGDGAPAAQGDVFEELSNALMSAQPKIQRMCEEESDDTEAVAKLLEINDSIHRTVERYKLVLKGDIEGANRIPKGTLGTSGAGVSRGANNELSLIDLGGEDEPQPVDTNSTASNPPRSSNPLEDDLLGLSLEENYGQTGALSLGSSTGTTFPASPPLHGHHLSNAQITSMFSSGSAAAASAPQPALNAFAAISNPIPSTSTPPPAQAAPRLDPFASLTSSSSQQASPFQFQQSAHPPPAAVPRPANSLLDLAPQAPPVPAPAAAAAAPASATDDEWVFASALPEQQTHSLTVTNGAIKVQWAISRPPIPNVIEIRSTISNNTAHEITEMTFQVAVTKNLKLNLETQSGRQLAPKQADGIGQTIQLVGVEPGKGMSIKMRWIASYMVGGERRDESGQVDGLGIS